MEGDDALRAEAGCRQPALSFGILGPVEARAGSRLLRLGGPGQRSLLAGLLLRANQVVSSHALIGAIWGETPPRTATAKLHGHVSALRRDLGGRAPLVLTRAPGYLIALGPEQLDLFRFDRLAGEGRALLGQAPAPAAAKLRAALSVWRGQPLEDLDLGGEFAAEAAILRERRLSVLEERIDAELRAGRHAELVAELEGLTLAHPLRERLHGQLMIALSRSGRRADALGAFRRARRLLAEETGLDPGRELQRLERAILVGEDEFDAPAAPGRVRHLGLPVRQLPPARGDLVGRDETLAALRRCVTGHPARDWRPTPCVVIGGGPGTGKTAVAIRAAHELRSGFPDGQLYLSLRTADGPIGAGALLATLLRTLGVESEMVPESVAGREHLYRSVLSGRQVLVVLDDAAGEAQVRPLIPGEPGSAALITSRARLEGIEGARRVDVGLLSPEHGVELVARVAGRELAASERGVAAQLVRSCGRLPLALQIAGAKLAARPHWSIAHLAERLRDERRRLDELRAGDLDVRASLARSYRGLGREEQRAFRLTSLFEMREFTSHVAAPLLGVDVPTADDLLERLVAAWLLDAWDRSGRTHYSFQSLVRLFARECAEADVGESLAHRQDLDSVAR
ncbi:MAG TPA: BTAD domain-containing putative transcriptional regulator [Candidatus Dormibacteraeota bacterium]|nr:BTAD domain-containing putative transcriptional regulator [Candidatus Dormibacteraeota bacterium]